MAQHTPTKAQAFDQIAVLLAMRPTWNGDTATAIADIVDDLTDYPHPGGADSDEETAQFYLNLGRSLGVDVNEDLVCAEQTCWVAVISDDERFCDYHRDRQEEYHGLTGLSMAEYEALTELEEWQGWRTIVAWVNAGGDALLTDAKGALNGWARTYGGSE